MESTTVKDVQMEHELTKGQLKVGLHRGHRFTQGQGGARAQISSNEVIEMPLSDYPDLRVLLVEDDDSVAIMMEYYFHHNGLEITRAATMAEAIDTAASAQWDLVLLDLDLPDSKPTGTIERINMFAERSTVIVLTGAASESDGIAAIRGGAQDCLLKADALGNQDRTYFSRCVSQTIERVRRNKQRDAALQTLNEVCDELGMHIKTKGERGGQQ